MQWGLGPSDGPGCTMVCLALKLGRSFSTAAAQGLGGSYCVCTKTAEGHIWFCVSEWSEEGD